MRERLRALAHYWIPGLVILGFLAAWHQKSAPLQRLRREYFDALNRAHPRARFDAPVVIVAIDDESLKNVGQWPWPRTEIARLLDRLRELGAATVALDIVFAEPDRTSPRQLADNIPAAGDWKRLRERYLSLPDHDEALAKSLSDGRAVVDFALTGQASENPPLAKAAIDWPSPLAAAAEALPGYAGTVKNLPVLEKAAAGNACLTYFEDSDGVVRRIPLILQTGNALYPGLSIESVRVAERIDAITVRGDLSEVAVGPHVVPTGSDGSLRLYFEEGEKTKVTPAWQLLDKHFKEANIFKGKIVLVGLVASGLQDQSLTPVGSVMASVDVHAEAIGQILEGSFLTQPVWADRVELLSLIALSVGLLLLMPQLGPALGGLAALGAIGSLAGLSFLAYARRGWLLDPVIPALALASVYLSSTLALYLRARAEKRKLELNDRLKDELISTVSHDLRGPVASIIMYMDAILGGTYGPLTDKQRKMLTLLRDSSRRLTFFVSNILDAARIKAGRLQFHLSELRVEDLFAEVDGLYLSAAQQKKVTLEHRVAADLPPFQGDREKIEQVLNNLVGNALKFTPNEGRITLAAEINGDELVFSVIDTGLGIAPEQIPDLFAKFQELDMDRPPENRAGTGLGLSICKAIVDAHHGTIAVESKLKEGTTVTVRLPLRQAKPETPAA